MRNVKYAVPQFLFYDRTGIQTYLEKQAMKGWLLEDFGAFGWKFRRIEPRKLHFSVTYLPKQTDYNSEFCLHAGWKVAAEDDCRRIFYNEREKPTPIDTDVEMELVNIHSVSKKKFLAEYLFWIILMTVHMVIFFLKWSRDFTGALSGQLNLTACITCMLMLFLRLADVLVYFRWYRKAKKTVALYGAFTDTNSYGSLRRGEVLTVFLLALLSIDVNDVLVFAVMSGVIAGAAVLIGFIRMCMKHWYVRKRDQLLTILLIILVFIGISLSGKGLTWAERQGYIDLSRDSISNSILGYALGWERVEQPMFAKDLYGEGSECGTNYWTVKDSVIMGEYTMDQLVTYGEDHGRMRYTITKVKIPGLYDRCLAELLNQHDYIHYSPVDASPWGAEAAYQLRSGEFAYGVYLLCYGDRIVEFETYWELTEEQIALVAEKLGGK